jgi:nucleoside-diphosphate-sugar epimerase
MTDWRALHGNAFSGESVLVTGGAGFIGGHLVRALLDLGAKVAVLDDLSGLPAGLADTAWRPSGLLTVGSILDLPLLARLAQGRRYIFHLAALGSVPASVRDPARYHQTNATGTFNVLDTARQAGAGRVIFSASSSAYGDSPRLPKVESMPTSPMSPYAASKVAGEALLSAFAACYPLDTVSLRYFNIFGPRQNANSAYAAVIAAFAKSLLAGQPPVIFGDGEQSRDFTYVDNAVHANLLAARSYTPLQGAILNVACGQRVTVNQLATDMATLLGRPDLTPRHEPPRTGDVKHSLADLTLAKQRLGYQPIVDFEPGLRATVMWYREAAGG